tara:strand:- start:1 stop:555 length:555 start_codon:yes stop_codon:yes gene_type:complete
MEFSFGIPSQRGKTSAKSVDLCPNLEALTICKNAGPRTAKLMVLNPLTCERLGLEDDGQIAFDFTREQLTIVNATGMSLPKGQGHTVKIKKEYAGLTFKDSKLWSHFVKTYNLDETSHSNFIITDTVNTDPVACSLTLETKQESTVTLDMGRDINVTQILDQVSLSSNGSDTAEEVSNFNNPNY